MKSILQQYMVFYIQRKHTSADEASGVLQVSVHGVVLHVELEKIICTVNARAV